MKMRYQKLAISMLVAGVLAACAQANATDNKKDAPTQASATSNKTVAAATNDPRYVIGPQDVLSINVWKEPEISMASVPVRPDGKISLPLINDIQAAGDTPMQLTAEIRDKLKTYVNDPRVTVIVTAINSERVYLLGEVLRPGAYPLLPDMTVLQAISSSGGFTQYANSKKVYVLRSENGKQKKYPFNYKAVVKGENPGENIALKSGDTIVVP